MPPVRVGNTRYTRVRRLVRPPFRRGRCEAPPRGSEASQSLILRHRVASVRLRRLRRRPDPPPPHGGRDLRLPFPEIFIFEIFFSGCLRPVGRFLSLCVPSPCGGGFPGLPMRMRMRMRVPGSGRPFPGFLRTRGGGSVAWLPLFASFCPFSARIWDFLCPGGGLYVRGRDSRNSGHFSRFWSFGAFRVSLRAGIVPLPWSRRPCGRRGVRGLRSPALSGGPGTFPENMFHNFGKHLLFRSRLRVKRLRTGNSRMGCGVPYGP